MAVKTRLTVFKIKAYIFINYLVEVFDVTALKAPRVWMFILPLLKTKFMKNVLRDKV